MSQLSTHIAHLTNVSPITPDHVDQWRLAVIESLARFESQDRIARIEEPLSYKYVGLLDGASEAVRSFADGLTTRHKRMSTHLTQGQQADELFRDIEDGFDTTRTTIVRFMHLVGKLAQAIIFARDSTLFDTLGISKDLFNALPNLSEEEIEKIGANVISELRKSPASAREELRTASISLYTALSAKVPRGFSVPALSLRSIDHKKGASLDQIQEALHPLFDLWRHAEEQRVNQFCQDLKDAYIKKQLQTSELSALWRAAQKSITKWTSAISGGGFVFGAGVYILTALEQAGMSTASGTYGVLIGLLSGAITGWFGNIFSRRRFGDESTYSNKLSDVEANFHRNIGALIETFKNCVSELPLSTLTSVVQSGFVGHKETILSTIGEENIDIVFQQMHEYDEAIGSAERDYGGILRAYSQKLEEFAGDPDLIEIALNQFSVEHWNKTLSPPLTVLEEVNRSLTETSHALSSVKFAPYH